MTSRPKTHAQGPGFTHTEYLATLAAGYETGWYDEDGRPAPWPDDFLDPNNGWHTPTSHDPVPLNPGEQPF